MSIVKSLKVLFISHAATRSGAPIVLLNLLSWLKKNTDLKFDILLLNEGPLQAEFEKLAKTVVLNKIAKRNTYSKRIKHRLLKTTEEKIQKAVAKYFLKANYTLVYGNTVLSLPWLKIFKEDHSLKTICCIHELSHALTHLYQNEYLQHNLKQMDAVIAVSEAVKENLILSYDLPEKKVHLHYEFIDTDTPVSNSVTRKELGINNEYLIGTGGTPEWRKGVDLVMPLILNLTTKYPDLDFKIVWLGAGENNGFAKQEFYDAEKSGVKDRLLFIEAKSNPLDYINLFDVFVLLSREDPFPLIALEAAFLKKPIIAFEKSGGIPELLIQGAGFLAPYLNVQEVARLINELAKDGKLSTATGETGNQLIVSNYNPDVVVPGIYALINKLAAN